MATDLGFIDPTEDPTASGGREKVAMAPRPMNLAGKVVALLDNTKEQGELILQTIGDALRERHGIARAILRRKDHYSKPAPDELIDELAREAQVAVVALGG
ncbi:MAG: hypothetical protein HY323_18765 [Betaproteobacteria bacterium]|nr:hypothetical protein [Betaproteobacteria bacterium]MBI3939020.1 hypothetical protein [Betaproteobacteria bacterium]